MHAVALAVCIISLQLTAAAVVNYESDGGAVRDDASLATSWKNGAALNSTLAQLLPGDTLLVPNATFHLMGGCVAYSLSHVIIQIDGTLVFSGATQEWPRGPDGKTVSAPNFQTLNP